MTIDDTVKTNRGNCWYDGQHQYQRFMDDAEKLVHKGQNAFCLVQDDKCKYYKTSKCNDYCKANVRELKEERNERKRLYE